MINWGNSIGSNTPESEETSKPKQPEVTSVENRIYFYSEVERDKTLQLNKMLRDIDNDHTSLKIKTDANELLPIYIHINSYGGSLHAGLSSMDNILLCKSPVITIVDGICASAATFISVAGKRRQMTKHSMMLIHQISSAFWGKYSEFEDEKKNLDKCMDIIKGIYKEYTKIPSEKLDDILKHDLYFTADECLQYGLIDEII